MPNENPARVEAAGLLQLAQRSAWAMLPEALIGTLRLLADGVRTGAAPARPQAAARRPLASGAVAPGRAIAVLRLHGVIVPRTSRFGAYFGTTALDDFRAQLRQAVADPSISAILLHVDSPGGLVDGVPETAAALAAARGHKPVVAVADGMMASAAYWIAAAAGKVVASPSAELGSIGVWTAHADLSRFYEKAGVDITLLAYGRHKTEGNPYEPLSDDARAHLQANVDAFGDMFAGDVARFRGVSKADASGPRFGEGRVFVAQDAVRRGLADQVATVDQAIALAARAPAAGTGRAARFRRRLAFA